MQRYERVSADRIYTTTTTRRIMLTDHVQVAADDGDGDDHAIAHSPTPIPASPPPSFTSRTSRDDQHRSEEERNLDDAFDAPSDDEDEDDRPHDQRRLISGDHAAASNDEEAEVVESVDVRRPAAGQRRVTEIPAFAPSTPGTRVVGNSQSNDGVFANLNAKPRVGEDLEEKPPTYEQAAADATPPYWETTVLSPYATTGNPDDVFVDGLLVGSLFSFIWNALISMSFQLIGFLLTYLLHTTRAAKHGSRAGLGITLVQYGFQMRYASSGSTDPSVPGAPADGVPTDPNAHDFDPSQVGGVAGGHTGFTTTDILSYVLMIVGWFILIRAVSDFLRARRQEQLVRSSPDRGLGVAVVAEGEQPETSV